MIQFFLFIYIVSAIIGSSFILLDFTEVGHLSIKRNILIYSLIPVLNTIFLAYVLYFLIISTKNRGDA